MKTTVVIPNYNGKQFLRDCFQSLQKNEHDFDTIMVDNGSNDGSVEFVSKEFPSVKIIQNEKNLGFSGAVNKGIKAAKTPYVILLNNDTEVFDDFVKELESAMDRNKNCFGISSKMLSMSKKELIDDAGDYYCSLGWAFARGKDQVESKYEKEVSIFAPCAGAAIYNKKVMEHIGLFDEEHFAYLEDIDIAYRAKIFGYSSKFCPTAKVYHVGSGFSGSRYNEFKVSLAARNSIYIIWKNMPMLQIIINSPLLLIGFLTKTLFFAKKGFLSVYTKSLVQGIKMCNAPKNKLKRIKFQWKNLKNYVGIQMDLWVNVFRRFL